MVVLMEKRNSLKGTSFWHSPPPVRNIVFPLCFEVTCPAGRLGDPEITMNS